MLTLEACVIEDCDGLTYKDVTGPYATPGNPGGYGVPNDITGPSDFDTYTLSVWLPGSDTSGTADFVYDLLENVPAPDSDGFYSWAFTAEDLGLSVMTSGVYTFTATGTSGQSIFMDDVQKIFVKDVKSKVIDPAMKSYDPMCGCKEGCVDPTLLFAQFLTVTCDGVCDAAKSQSIINYLYTQQDCC